MPEVTLLPRDGSAQPKLNFIQNKSDIQIGVCRAYRELTKCHVERVKRVETSVFRFFDFAVASLRMTKRLFLFKLEFVGEMK